MKKKVAYQGVKGAYSHLACYHQYPEYEAIACKSFDETMYLVEEDEADTAENFDEEDNEFGVDYIQISKNRQPCDCVQCSINAFIKLRRGDVKGKPKIKKDRDWYLQVQKEFHRLKATGNLPELKAYWLPKTKKSARVIPIFNKKLIRMLRSYFDKHDKFELNRFQIWERVKKVTGKALPDKRLYPHALRATCATNLARRGFGAYDLTSFMGWENIQTANSHVKEDTHHMVQSLKDLEQNE